MYYIVVWGLPVLIYEPGQNDDILFAPVLLDLFIDIHPKLPKFKLFNGAVSQHQDVLVDLYVQNPGIHDMLIFLHVQSIMIVRSDVVNESPKSLPAVLQSLVFFSKSLGFSRFLVFGELDFLVFGISLGTLEVVQLHRHLRR